MADTKVTGNVFVVARIWGEGEKFRVSFSNLSRSAASTQADMSETKNARDSLGVGFGFELLNVRFLNVELPSLLFTESDRVGLRVEFDVSTLHVISTEQPGQTRERISKAVVEGERERV